MFVCSPYAATPPFHHFLYPPPLNFYITCSSVSCSLFYLWNHIHFWHIQTICKYYPSFIVLSMYIVTLMQNYGHIILLFRLLHYTNKFNTNNRLYCIKFNNKFWKLRKFFIFKSKMVPNLTTTKYWMNNYFSSKY